MRNVEKKQEAIRDIVMRLCDGWEVKFDMSRRAKTLLGKCSYMRKRLTFYRPLFEYNLASCIHCALHEVAHQFQKAMCGYSRHDEQFREILNMLIEDYGTEEVACSKKNKRALSYNNYTKDTDDEN